MNHAVGDGVHSGLEEKKKRKGERDIQGLQLISN